MVKLLQVIQPKPLFFFKHKSHSKRERSHRSVQKQGLMNPDFETDVLKTVVFSC